MPAVLDYVRFLGSFVRHPMRTGAVAPSSRWLAGRMVAEMGLERAQTVVEVGPGTGSFTRAILQTVRPGTLVLAVEINPAFARRVAERFPGATVVNDTAERLPALLAERGRGPAEAVVSGLPWAGFPEDLQTRLMDAIYGSMAPGAKFATFAYVHAAGFAPGRRFREMIESRFRRVTATKTVWLNLPPAFVYRCEK